MLGVVFCGGKSLRMGTDKGLIPITKQNWSTLAAEKLRSLCIPVKVSIRAAQIESYSAFFNVQQMVIDSNKISVEGPLLGLLSVHEKYPDEDVLILACDLPLMTENLLQKLVLAAQSHNSSDAFCYTNSGFAEPLCAVYKASALRKIVHKLNSGSLAKYSMKYVLSMLQCFEIELSKEEIQFFKNFNSQGFT